MNILLQHYSCFNVCNVAGTTIWESCQPILTQIASIRLCIRPSLARIVELVKLYKQTNSLAYLHLVERRSKYEGKFKVGFVTFVGAYVVGNVIASISMVLYAQRV